MIKIELHFPNAAAAAEALLRVAGTPPATLPADDRPGVWARMLPADAVQATDVAQAADAAPEIPLSSDTRLIGIAGSGGRRRTKAEIADDDELTELGAGFGVTVDALNNAILTQGRAAVRHDLARSGEAFPLANISTAPEDRQDPENPEPADEPEATDEAGPDDSVAPLTEDDVRNVVRAAMTRIGPVKTAELMLKVGGATSVTKVPPANYGRLIEALAKEPA